MQARIVVPPRLLTARRLTRTKAGVAGLQMTAVCRKQRLDEPRGAQAETRNHALDVRAVATLGRGAAQFSFLAFEINAFAAGFEPIRRQKAALAAVQFERELRQIEDAPGLQDLRKVGSLGRLDALVNCAGRVAYEGFEMDEFLKTVEVNLSGTMRMSIAVHPLLAKQGGAIVNIASMYSFFGSTIAPGYASSKGGIVALTRSFAAAWAKDGIRCNAVAPGWIRTGMAKQAWEDEAMHKQIADRTPMGRWGDPEELGDVIGFLCAPESRFVTGAIIPVHGGYPISG